METLKMVREQETLVPKFSKPVISGVTRDELGNLLEKCKISFLVLRLQLDALNLKKNHE